ncbi:type II toxin-antitoxin system PemK/MazF family toxin [bacterium]|nr:type II toxin-antitoxin system PemK/MazF family toxin [bacterium]
MKQFEIWIADLNPQIDTETGKTRPVIILQTDLLNAISHPSTIICPMTTNIQKEADILRIHIQSGIANMKEDSDIMIDQIRAIDNRRLIKKIGRLPQNLIDKVIENVAIVLDIYLPT